MRLVLFDDHRPGALAADGSVVVPIDDLVGADLPPRPQDRIVAVIERWPELRPHVEGRVAASRGVPIAEVRLRPPLPRPGKIICARANYREGSDREPWPMDAFLKSPEAVIGPGDTVVLPERQHTVFHHEAELAVVIGTRMTKVPASDVMRYVFGYTGFMDISARKGIGRPDGASFLGKSYDTFAPLGPVVVTADEIADPHALHVRYWVNGHLRHDYNTSDIEHGVPEFLEFVSSVMTLCPGDVVSMGTNHQQIGPVQHGDVCDLEIDGIGLLTVDVVDPLRREWPREIDQEIATRVRQSLVSPVKAGDSV
jgi:2-keto-4-pentenoate hydratase/2-oxohepta-3-ene-1,7-dioic acid hydratase in catechol pathway